MTKPDLSDRTILCHVLVRQGVQLAIWSSGPTMGTAPLTPARPTASNNKLTKSINRQDRLTSTQPCLLQETKPSLLRDHPQQAELCQIPESLSLVSNHPFPLSADCWWSFPLLFYPFFFSPFLFSLDSHLPASSHGVCLVGPWPPRPRPPHAPNGSCRPGSRLIDRRPPAATQLGPFFFLSWVSLRFPFRLPLDASHYY